LCAILDRVAGPAGLEANDEIERSRLIDGGAAALAERIDWPGGRRLDAI
jgi:hypothetical protein